MQRSAWKLPFTRIASSDAIRPLHDADPACPTCAFRIRSRGKPRARRGEVEGTPLPLAAGSRLRLGCWRQRQLQIAWLERVLVLAQGRIVRGRWNREAG